MKTTKFMFGAGAGLGLALMSSTVIAGDVYRPYPITLKGYDGDKTESVSYSGQVDLPTIFGVNIFVISFHALGSNLRQSHVSIRYPKAVEQVLMSPAQHQLHHSEVERHFDQNFGVALSLWDRIFGSFHHSVSEKLTFGIGRETAGFTKSIWSIYWLPVRDRMDRFAALGRVMAAATWRGLPQSMQRRS